MHLHNQSAFQPPEPERTQSESGSAAIGLANVYSVATCTFERPSGDRRRSTNRDRRRESPVSSGLKCLLIVRRSDAAL